MFSKVTRRRSNLTILKPQWIGLPKLPAGFMALGLALILLTGQTSSENQDQPAKISVKRDMVFLKSACYTMGSEEYIAEEPEHEVCLNPFYLDRYEVTQKQFKKVMGFNPSHVKGDRLPVESVTWPESDIYCRKLGLRVPTEAEWEYAARAGASSSYAWGWDMDDAYGWYKKNSNAAPHPVGQKKPNALGFFDMNGNVWEWVADWFHPDYYEISSQSAPINDPQGPMTGQFVILRGGSFEDDPFYLRSAARYWYQPDLRNRNLGFRCAGNPEEITVTTKP